MTRVSTGQFRRLTLILTLGVLSPAVDLPGSQGAAQLRDWTVLVYMNGDNNLEPFALRDFREMAHVGSNSEVTVVVQLDRIGKYVSPSPEEPSWTDTKRFLIRKGSKPLASEALINLGEINMGDPKALEDFVRWGRKSYPAKRYALVIWDHGQGFRDVADAPPLNAPFRSSSGAPHRSVSDDDTDGDKLFNSEVTAALQSALGDGKLDVLGFDACLMAMIETAYAMRDVSHYMVGSEELEPGDGWQYDDVLQKLQHDPRRGHSRHRCAPREVCTKTATARESQRRIQRQPSLRLTLHTSGCYPTQSACWRTNFRTALSRTPKKSLRRDLRVLSMHLARTHRTPRGSSFIT